LSTLLFRAYAICDILGSMILHTEEREKAIKLRKHGLSYGEIQKKVHVSKSSLSLWLKSVSLPEKHRKRLYTKQIEILSRGSQSQKERRKREIEVILAESAKDIKTPLSIESLRLMGAALYWAEGSKTGTLQFTNSDPHLILFFVRWVEAMFQIKSSTLKGRINMYPQQNEKALKQFWSDLTGIPFDRFGKSFVKPLSKNYKKNNLYYGTMRVEVPKSVDNKHRIFGWIQAALNFIAGDVAATQKRWKNLTEVARPVNLK